MSNWGNRDAWPSTGVTEGCQFDAGHFHFTVMMKFDFDHYRIELAPEEVRLSLSHDATEGPFWVWAPTAFNVTNGIGNVM